ncbi:MAG: permease [Alphaproteobacteria bacterium]|nr:permease [Alphaproteobacteria bacterium]MCB9792003.1 permease [Alphaproteobacteria bacterium]
MKWMILVLGAVLGALVALAAWQGQDVLQAGLRGAGRQLLGFAPIIGLAVAIAGFAEVLLPQELVEAWLSDASGWRGIAIAWIAGILTPAGSVVGLPLVAALYKAGVGVGVLVTYVTSFALLSLIRLPIEVGFLGWRLAALRVGCSLVLPLIAGWTARWVWPMVGSG